LLMFLPYVDIFNKHVQGRTLIKCIQNNIQTTVSHAVSIGMKLKLKQ